MVTAALTLTYANTVRATTKPVNAQGLEIEPLLSTRTSPPLKEGLRRVRRSAPLTLTPIRPLALVPPPTEERHLTLILNSLPASLAPPARAREKHLDSSTSVTRRSSRRRRRRLSFVGRVQLLGTLLLPNQLPPPYLRDSGALDAQVRSSPTRTPGLIGVQGGSGKGDCFAPETHQR